ncbi:hypothetical protein IE81DRAFT_324971 [Ceraceosorus guamensis]|uniref:Uncharacterized protein n=1 Tax=Ceraceosorus guamensis TaxID=1522189 RepID=A0A316VZZ8_9BASI|nr:hypothetical protein IE81DRAFT_324971 [Ceraceosorus guamensis]PWN41055.1 hypothetical protein IE81DRAFT_324971 [Ceraceosorus guamensis]
MASASPAPARPLRHKTSTLRPGAGHGMGTGSGSGAGLWLSGSAEAADDAKMEATAQQQATEEPREVPTSATPSQRSSAQRTYHIAAEELIARSPTASVDAGLQRWNALEAQRSAQVSTDEEVDLNLSFDFTSQLEGQTRSPVERLKKRVAATVERMSATLDDQQDGISVQVAPPSPNAPSPARGMSEAAKWETRQRKRPPAPLFFLRSGKSDKRAHTTGDRADGVEVSHFSPISPAANEVEALPITPLSSTKRSADAQTSIDSQQRSAPSTPRSGRFSSSSSPRPDPPATLPPTEPLPALPTGADISALVKQQRLRAQQNQWRKVSGGSMPGTPTTEEPPALPDLMTLPQPSLTKGQQNTSLDLALPRTSHESVEVLANAASDPAYDYRKHLSRHHQHAASKSLTSSTAERTSKSVRRRHRARNSESSVESFATAATGVFPAVTTEEAANTNTNDTLMPIPRGNALGLDTGSANMALQNGPSLEVQTRTLAYPPSEAKTSPGTPFSALFSEPGTARTVGGGSEYTRSTASEVGTPSGTFSKLTAAVSGKRRGSLADALLSSPPPLSAVDMLRGHSAPTGSLFRDVIEEEHLAPKAERERTTSMPRSETLEWINAQKAMSVDDAEDGALAKAAPTSVTTHELRSTVKRRVSEVKGPWPQSPLLLDASSSEKPSHPASVSGQTAHKRLSLGAKFGAGIGLGLSQAPSSDAIVPHGLDGSVSVQRAAISPAHGLQIPGDAGAKLLAAPAASVLEQNDQSLRPSPSMSSSVEGFACNVTPPAPTHALPDTKHTVSSPPVLDADRTPRAPARARTATIAGDIERNSALSIVPGAADTQPSRPRSKAHTSAASGWGALANLRWGNKFFSIASSSGLTSHGTDTQATSEKRSPPMRSLTLLEKRDTRDRDGAAVAAQRRASYGHRRSHSREDLAGIFPHLERSQPSASGREAGIASAPATAILPSTPRFSSLLEDVEGVAAKPEAAHVQSRDNNRVKRRSRIRYLSNGHEIHLDMGEPNEPAPSREQPQRPGSLPLDAIKSPRVAASPSGWTPRLHFGPLWGSTAPASRADQRVGRTEAENSSRPVTPGSPWLDFAEGDGGLQASQDRAEYLAAHADQEQRSAQPLPEEEGIRRRGAGHQSTPSLPPTATIIPFGWATGASKRSSGSARVLLHDSSAAAGTVINVEDSQRRPVQTAGGPPGHGRPMSIFVPSAVIQEHLMRNAALQVSRMRRRRSQFPLPLGGPHAKLDLTSVPSKTLFFAGFLGMPWLWLIGGWWLSSEGRIATRAPAKVEFWQHEASMREAAERDAASRLGGAIFPSQGLAERSEGTPASDATGEQAGVATSGSGATVIEHPADVSNGTTHTLRTMRSHATVRSNASSAWADTSSRESPQSDSIPRSSRRSVSSILGSNPEIALMRSPVRSGEATAVPQPETVLALAPVRESRERASSRPPSVEALRAVLGDRDTRVQVHEAAQQAASSGTPPNSTMPYSSIPNGQPRTHKRSRSIGERVNAAIDHWAGLERFVLLNRIAAIVATLVVIYGSAAAVTVIVGSF